MHLIATFLYLCQVNFTAMQQAKGQSGKLLPYLTEVGVTVLTHIENDCGMAKEGEPSDENEVHVSAVEEDDGRVQPGNDAFDDLGLRRLRGRPGLVTP